MFGGRGWALHHWPFFKWLYNFPDYKIIHAYCPQILPITEKYKEKINTTPQSTSQRCHHQYLGVHTSPDCPWAPKHRRAHKLTLPTVHSPGNSPWGSLRLGCKQSVSLSISLIRPHWGRSCLKILRAWDESEMDTNIFRTRIKLFILFKKWKKSLFLKTTFYPCKNVELVLPVSKRPPKKSPVGIVSQEGKSSMCGQTSWPSFRDPCPWDKSNWVRNA